MKSQQSFPGHQCQNGAECVDGIAQYTCKCARGFEGLLCSNNTDDCASALCLNNATCVDQITNYTCLCSLGFTGEKKIHVDVVKWLWEHRVLIPLEGLFVVTFVVTVAIGVKMTSGQVRQVVEKTVNVIKNGPLHSTARSYFTDLW